MLKSSCEIARDCRACFDVPPLIAELALKQAAYEEVYKTYDRRSEALASDVGNEYVILEDRMLKVLELATFCKGKINDECGLSYVTKL